MAGKIEKTEQELTDSVTQAELALTVLNDAVENGEVAGGLPEGWIFTSLVKLTSKIGSGSTPRGGQKAYLSEGVPLIRSMNIHFDRIKKDGLAYISDDAAEKLKNVEVFESDVLLNITGASIGRVNIATNEYRGARVNQHVAIIRMQQNLSPKYTCYYLQSPKIQDFIHNNESGATRQALTKDKIENFEIPLPPLAEQTVIAQTLDTLLAQVDNIKNRLDAIPNILKTFRQSVLAAAVSGKLTEAWRGENEWQWKDREVEGLINNKPKDLSVDELQLAKQLTPGSILPEWNYYPLEQLVDASRGIPYGIVQTGAQVNGGVPTIRCGDVKWLRIDTSNLKEVDPDISSQYKRTLLKGNEVILAIRGTVGNAAVVPTGLRNCNISREVALVPLLSFMVPNFVALILQSPTGYRRLAEKVRGVAQKGINLADVKRFVTPVPIKEEQTQIVHRVEELFTFADQIEQQVQNAQGRVNNLTQSILAKAFRGELTAQWRAENSELISGENSAEALLAKIQKEREALKQKAKPKKKAIRKKTK